MRARPLSTTAVTPSTVTELSATFVARMSFLSAYGNTARSCSAGERSMQGKDQQTRLASDRFALTHGSADLGDARKENQDTAGVLPGIQQFHSVPHLNMKRLGGVRQMLDRQLKHLSLRPKDGTIFKVSSYRRRIERGRHHDDAYLRPGALETLQECQRKIAVQVTLVEFVEDNRVDALEGWIG
jgi:hypothetical protein